MVALLLFPPCRRPSSSSFPPRSLPSLCSLRLLFSLSIKKKRESSLIGCLLHFLLPLLLLRLLLFVILLEPPAQRQSNRGPSGSLAIKASPALTLQNCRNLREGPPARVISILSYRADIYVYNGCVCLFLRFFPSLSSFFDYPPIVRCRRWRNIGRPLVVTASNIRRKESALLQSFAISIESCRKRVLKADDYIVPIKSRYIPTRHFHKH